MADQSSGNSLKAKIILQQCLSGRLQVKPADDETPAEFVEVNRGIIVYVCFMKGASQDIVEKMVKAVLNVKLSQSDNGKTVSVLDLPGDVLIVPQATLGGKLKGKVMQYHSNIGKDEGLKLYSSFVQKTQIEVENNAKSIESKCQVKWGTYGNRQVLSIVTNGPYTHTLDF
ncbi:D-aminoacyl-tRNA deacylase 2-like [Ptychodera flava]|uniref:D-aminoacyl-tRNA deacylase 2-like n=1 Tax=Ptychodera flava TaxID=63121 RepID=UPI00396A5F30